MICDQWSLMLLLSLFWGRCELRPYKMNLINVCVLTTPPAVHSAHLSLPRPPSSLRHTTLKLGQWITLQWPLRIQVKGTINPSADVSHCCLILRNCCSHPRLQQPSPWPVSSHQHQGQTFHQQIKSCWRLRWWSAFFSNKFLRKLRSICFF